MKTTPYTLSIPFTGNRWILTIWPYWQPPESRAHSHGRLWHFGYLTLYRFDRRI